jgi:beta-lactamase regulating signal transducer with metallopeptidase domain
LNFLLELFRTIAHIFFAGLWQSLVLVAAVGVALRFCSRVGPQLRFAVWGSAFAVLLATPLLNFEAHPAPSVPLIAKVQLSAIWEYAIAILWVLLMAARAVQLTVHLSRLRGTWKRAIPIAADGDIAALLQSSPRSVELCSSAEVDSPSIIGFFSPRLLVPEWLLAKLTPQDTRQIVLHELEHLRRRDDWLNLMQKVGLVLFPLNPGLLWVDRKLAIERELACDAGVVAATTQPLEYARCLTRLAEYRSGYRKLALSLAAWSRESELGHRVLTLLQPAGTWSARHGRLAAVLFAVVLAGGAAEMAHMPHFVTFVDAHAKPERAAAAAVQEFQSATPVVYQATAQPRATLVKAVLRPVRTQELSAPTLRLQPQRKARAVKTRRQQPGVLPIAVRRPAETTQSPHSGRIVRALYVFPNEFSPSYAAVPFADGWLIVQL